MLCGLKINNYNLGFLWCDSQTCRLATRRLATRRLATHRLATRRLATRRLTDLHTRETLSNNGVLINYYQRGETKSLLRLTRSRITRGVWERKFSDFAFRRTGFSIFWSEFAWKLPYSLDFLEIRQFPLHFLQSSEISFKFPSDSNFLIISFN
jgi:hypothetical protein